jgi:hypothetical protein
MLSPVTMMQLYALLAQSHSMPLGVVSSTRQISMSWVSPAGAAAAAVLLQPAVVRGAVTVSLGASGAIFGLFAVSVLTRLSWDPRKLLEGLILGNFVVRQVRML